MMRSILNLVVALASAVINLAAAALGLLILIILYALVPIGLLCWSGAFSPASHSASSFGSAPPPPSVCPNCPMKLRLDLLEHLTDEDILEEVLANNHRYKPEPLFSRTGVGSLSSASTEERAQEEARSTALIERLKRRSQQNGLPSRTMVDWCGGQMAAAPNSHPCRRA